MVDTRFKYEIKLNGEPINVALGSVFVEKLQEPLDEGAINIPIDVKDYEFEMFGWLDIKFIGFTNEKVLRYYISSDEVEPLTKDGFYTHNLTLIEYTYSADTRLIKALSFTQSLRSNKTAPFFTNFERNSITSYDKATINEWIPPIDIKYQYFVDKDYVIPQCIQGYTNFGSSLGRLDVFTRLYSPSNVIYNESLGRFIPNGTHDVEVILSSQPQTLNLDQNGLWILEYGLVDYNSTETGLVPRMVFYTFYIEAILEQKLTLYDYIDRIRNVVPLETKFNHGATRLFNLDTNLVDRFKQIEMPQIFLNEMTLRQALNTIFKFINAIMRLEYAEENLDTLTIDEFNKVVGSFEIADMVSFKTSQSLQGYGTKMVSWLRNTLQTNFRDNPSIKTPSTDFYKTVRAKSVQLVEGQNGFILPLDGGELYELINLEVVIPKLTYGAYNIDNPSLTIDEPFVLSLNNRVVPLEEWDLKLITNNFPSYKKLGICEQDVGLRPNKGGNIYWERGKNYIDFSKEFGDWFSETLIMNAFQEQLAEYFTINMPLSILPSGFLDTRVGFNVDNIDANWFYKNIGFNIEYVTLKETTVKNHRSDISIINKETEIRLNQSSRLVDFGLASKNAVGNIERIGVPNKKFSRIHTDLDSLLTLGLKDSNGYVITEAKYEIYNDYIIGNYEVTKDHIRLSEFIGIDRAYRAFTIPSSNDVYKRQEHYEDFIIVDKLDSVLSQENVLYNNTFIENVFKTLVASDTNKNKITFAFVRTDGFSSIYQDSISEYKAIMAPISSFGGQQVLLFTFGFDSNIVAGNAIYKQGTKFFNNPIKYTDLQGIFKELWFGMSDIYVETTPFAPIGDMLETIFNETYNYPLIRSSTSDLKQNFLIKTGEINGIDYNPIMFYKDKSEVLSQFNYQVSILSKEYKDYILGTDFFVKNRTVYNPLALDTLYLYKYKDNTQYDIFENNLIKGSISLYDYDKIELIASGISQNIVFDNFENKVYFQGNAEITSAYTSWAIGDGDGNLYIACNLNENGFSIKKRHTRPGIIQINSGVTYYYMSVSQTITSSIVVDNKETNYTFNEVVTTSTNFDYGQDENITLETIQVIENEMVVFNTSPVFLQENIQNAVYIFYGEDEYMTLETTQVINHNMNIFNTAPIVFQETIVSNVTIDYGQDESMMLSVVQSINPILSVFNTTPIFLDEDISSEAVISVDTEQYINMEVVQIITSNITVFNTTPVSSINEVVTSIPTMTYVSEVYVWEVVAGTTYDTTLSVFVDTPVTSSEITAELTNGFPPGDYGVNTRARVRVYDSNTMSLYTTTYRIVGLQEF